MIAAERTFVGVTGAVLEEAEEKRLALAPRKVADLQLVARVHGLLASSGGEWSRNKLAKALGCNPAYVVQWMKQGDASGNARADAPVLAMDLPRFEASVAEFLDSLAERRNLSADLFETAVTRQFVAFVRAVRASKDVGVFHSAAGRGKTSAIALFARNNPLSLVITATAWACGRQAVQGLLFRALSRGQRWDSRKGAQGEWIAERLRGSERVIIVDNYHRLTAGAFALLFDLHDEVGVPVIMAGNPSGLERLERDDQLFSRVGLRREATFGTDKRAAEAALRDAVERLLMRDAPQHVEALKGLGLEVAREQGALRGLRKHVALAVEIARQSGVGIVEAFRQAHGSLVHRGYQLKGGGNE